MWHSTNYLLIKFNTLYQIACFVFFWKSTVALLPNVLTKSYHIIKRVGQTVSVLHIISRKTEKILPLRRFKNTDNWLLETIPGQVFHFWSNILFPGLHESDLRSDHSKDHYYIDSSEYYCESSSIGHTRVGTMCTRQCLLDIMFWWSNAINLNIY